MQNYWLLSFVIIEYRILEPHLINSLCIFCLAKYIVYDIINEVAFDHVFGFPNESDKWLKVSQYQLREEDADDALLRTRRMYGDQDGGF